MINSEIGSAQAINGAANASTGDSANCSWKTSNSNSLAMPVYRKRIINK
jgi:hypothetical protein